MFDLSILERSSIVKKKMHFLQKNLTKKVIYIIFIVQGAVTGIRTRILRLDEGLRFTIKLQRLLIAEGKGFEPLAGGSAPAIDYKSVALSRSANPPIVFRGDMLL